ncbi:hypothetical protein [Spirosoma harenae]
MKTSLRNSRRPFLKALSISTALGLIVGCQDIKDIQNIDPLNGVVFKLNYQPAKTQIQGLVVDAKTGMPLEVPIQISILGKDASRTITFEGKAVTSYTAPKGDLFIGLKGNIPTKTAPAELRVIVDAEGYVSSSTNLTLMSESNAPFVIRLVKTDAVPNGVGAVESTVAATSTGALAASKSIEVTTSANGIATPVQTTLSLPANTVLKDEKGQPIVGNIKMSVVAYAGQNEQVSNLFPGGLVTTIAKDASGKTDVRKVFQPVGFVAIDMTGSNGQQVSTFSQPVQIEMSVPSTTINPSTNQPVKVGDKMAVYSYNEKTGVWTYERSVAVEQQGGKLVVKAPITHLSYYAVECDTPTSSTYMFQVTVAGNVGYPKGFPITWRITNKNGTLVFGATGELSSEMADGSYSHHFDTSVPTYNPIGMTAPNNGYTITITSASGEVLYTEDFTANFTLMGGMDFKYLQIQKPYKPGLKAKFTIQAKCENGKNLSINPSGITAFVTPLDNSAVTVQGFGLYAQFENGVGTFTGLAKNTKYKACVYNQGAFCEEFTTGETDSEQTLNYILKANTQVCK